MTIDIESKPTESYPGAQSVSRAIAVLKAFDDAHAEWTLSDLSDFVGLNKTTAHRILAALESDGMVNRTTLGAYRLGIELIGLGGCAMRSNDLRRAARTELEMLARETNESVTLEVLSKRHVLILDEVSHRDPLAVAQGIGARLPVHATSTGKLLLAHLPEIELDAILAGRLTELTPLTIVDPGQLRGQLAEILQLGFATAVNELDIGFAAVAAPVYSAEHQVVAAVSVGGPALRLTEQLLPEIAASLQVTARRVSRELGYRPT